MKNICFLIGNLSYSGGTERVTSLLANELSKKNFNVSILSFFGGDEPFFELQNDIKYYSMFPEKVSFKKEYFNTVLKIRDFVKKHNINSLILVDSNSYIYTLPALVGVEVKQICWEQFNFNVNLDRISRDIARRLAARYCDLIITLTKADKELWLKGTKHNNQIISIPNPSTFDVLKKSSQSNNKTVLAVGRLAKQKGFDLLLHSWLQVNRAHPDWKLVIVGEGEERRCLEEFIISNNLSSSVRLVGNTKNVDNYYKEAEIFCLSSRFEGFGMVLVEALSFGLPVVSFDCEYGPLEILNGTGSILVPAENVQILALSLIKLIDDESLRTNIGYNNTKRAQNYQMSNIIDQWIAQLN